MSKTFENISRDKIDRKVNKRSRIIKSKRVFDIDEEEQLELDNIIADINYGDKKIEDLIQNLEEELSE